MLIKKKLLEIEIPIKRKNNIGVVVKDDILAARLDRGIRAFFDRKNFIIYDEKKQIWNEINPFTESAKYEKTDIDVILRYFKKPAYYFARAPHQILSQTIEDIRAKKREAASAAKWSRIAAAVSMLPRALPNETKTFLNSILPIKSVVLSELTKTGKSRIKCMHCGKTTAQSTPPKHKNEWTCPKCKTKTTALRQRYASAKANEDVTGVIFYFGETKTLEIVATTFRGIDENLKYTFRYDTNFFTVKDETNEVKYREYKYVNMNCSWCDARSEPNFYCKICSDGIGEFYGQKLSGVNLNNLSNVDGDKFFRLVRVLDYGSHKHLAKSLVNRNLPNLAASASLLPLSQNWDEVFKIPRDYMKKVKEWNITYNELLILRKADCYVDDKLFHKIREVFKWSVQGDDLERTLREMGFRKTINYFYKQMKKTGEMAGNLIYKYREYLRMFEELSKKLGESSKMNEQQKFPKDIIKAHEKISDTLRIQDNGPKNMLINDIYVQYADKLKLKDDKLVVIMPSSLKDFIDEGRKLGHCVASGYSYINRHIEKSKMTFFIRKSDNLKEPYVTFSIDTKTFEVTECFGKRDKIPPAYVKKCAEKFAKKLSTVLIKTKKGKAASAA